MMVAALVVALLFVVLYLFAVVVVDDLTIVHCLNPCHGLARGH